MELIWQQTEGPCTGLPSLTEQTQWLIRPLQPPSGKTLKCRVFELKLKSLRRLSGGEHGALWLFFPPQNRRCSHKAKAPPLLQRRICSQRKWNKSWWIIKHMYDREKYELKSKPLEMWLIYFYVISKISISSWIFLQGIEEKNEQLCAPLDNVSATNLHSCQALPPIDYVSQGRSTQWYCFPQGFEKMSSWTI